MIMWKMWCPFRVAYAISIHKAQGLEYESVKVLITSEIEEMVSHNIFYTAITRAKSKLKIYWSPETEKRILENMKVQFNDKDYQLFKAKYKRSFAEILIYCPPGKLYVKYRSVLK